MILNLPSVLLDWAESSLDNLNKTELTKYQKKLVTNLYLFYYTVTLNKPKIPNQGSSENTHSNENFNGSSSNDKSIYLLDMIIDALTIVGYQNINKDRTIRDIRKCKGDIEWTLINKYKLIQGQCKNIPDRELMNKVISETSNALAKKIMVPYSDDGGVSDGLEHLFQ